MNFINITFLVSGLLVGFALGFVIAARIYYFSPAAKRFHEMQAKNDRRSAAIEKRLDEYFKN